MALDIARLDLLVKQIPHDVFAAQRWFRSKSRPIADLALADAAPLVANPGRRDAALVVVRVSFNDGGADELYLLPMVYVADEPGPSPAKEWGIVAVRDATGGVLREPRDDDGVWRSLAEAAAAEMTLSSLHGSFAFHVLPALAEIVPSAVHSVSTLGERRLGGEQTNTSVVLGERLMLKLYRCLEPGENPDLELPRFLSQVGFTRVPAVAGYVRYLPARGEPCAAIMLQAFVPGAADAWGWLLNELSVAAPADLALDAVERIGEITAEMHAALASRPGEAAFPIRDASPEELSDWRVSAQDQLNGALAALDRERHGGLRSVAPLIVRALDAITTAQDVRVSRIHGDYHLGQLLRDRSDFWVIDFEGEPARPLAARRAPASPLKDVAGMLRSLDYAARTVERNGVSSALQAEAWLAKARDALLRGYRAGGGQVDEGLLRAFELEKACYEVRYEANNRPDWVWLPLQALERLAGR